MGSFGWDSGGGWEGDDVKMIEIWIKYRFELIMINISLLILTNVPHPCIMLTIIKNGCEVYRNFVLPLQYSCKSKSILKWKY